MKEEKEKEKEKKGKGERKKKKEKLFSQFSNTQKKNLFLLILQ